MSLHLKNKSSNLSGTISIQGSKSISNRILIIRELSNSNNNIENLSSSDDTNSLAFHLNMINRCEISGIPMVVDVKNAGTVARFLTVLLAFRDGLWLLTGNSRMKQRPMVGLVDALRLLGADITYTEAIGFLPIRIIGKDIRGGEVDIDVTKSSQYVSALMMIGPYLEEGLMLNFSGHPVSFPYIEMTKKLMSTYGANVSLNKKSVAIKHCVYNFCDSVIEPDWSSASYWYEVVALSETGNIFIPGLQKNSIQGDKVLPDVFNQLGVITTFTKDGIRISKSTNIVEEFVYDFEGCPDIVPSVMATCAALGVNSKFININHLAYKESNRIESLTTELLKIGAIIKRNDNSYSLSVVEIAHNKLVFDTHQDHRIAMCLAPLVLKYDKIEIRNPEVVNKSYPEFWDDFKKLNFASIK